MRLDRALSKLGLASRADARRLITEGRVRVGSRVVSDPGMLVVPETAALVVDGTRARRPHWRTLALHKPRGVVTTRHDPEGRRTVFDLLGDEASGLVAVGRLDLASTGLLLLTTDTQLANYLTDPANAIPRTYAVTVRGAVADEGVAAMLGGIDGLRATSAEVRKRSARESHLLIVLSEGRNREIRRMLEALGHDVTRLLRVSFGPVELGRLQPGEWRMVERPELAALDWRNRRGRTGPQRGDKMVR